MLAAATAAACMHAATVAVDVRPHQEQRPNGSPGHGTAPAPAGAPNPVSKAAGERNAPPEPGPDDRMAAPLATALANLQIVLPPPAGRASGSNGPPPKTAPTVIVPAVPTPHVEQRVDLTLPAPAWPWPGLAAPAYPQVLIVHVAPEDKLPPEAPVRRVGSGGCKQWALLTPGTRRDALARHMELAAAALAALGLTGVVAGALVAGGWRRALVLGDDGMAFGGGGAAGPGFTGPGAAAALGAGLLVLAVVLLTRAGELMAPVCVDPPGPVLFVFGPPAPAMHALADPADSR